MRFVLIFSISIHIRLKVEQRHPQITVMEEKNNSNVGKTKVASSASMFVMEKTTVTEEKTKKIVFNIKNCLKKKTVSRLNSFPFYSLRFNHLKIPSNLLYFCIIRFQIQNTIPDGYKKDMTYTNVESAESCAKICMQRKHCSCTSFSFNEKRKKCIISDR